MEVTPPAGSKNQVDPEIADGRCNSSDELIERAVRLFLVEEQRDAVDRAGLYERVYIPGP